MMTKHELANHIERNSSMAENLILLRSLRSKRESEKDRNKKRINRYSKILKNASVSPFLASIVHKSSKGKGNVFVKLKFDLKKTKAFLKKLKVLIVE